MMLVGPEDLKNYRKIVLALNRGLFLNGLISFTYGLIICYFTMNCRAYMQNKIACLRSSFR